MAERKLEVEVLTPRGVVYRGEVDMVIARGTEGDLGIMPGHIPLVTALKISVLRLLRDGGEDRVAITGRAFMEVIPEKVTILANTAESADEIDVARAEAARERAKSRLRSDREDVDILRAQAALNRSLVRLRAVGEQDRMVTGETGRSEGS